LRISPGFIPRGNNLDTTRLASRHEESLLSATGEVTPHSHVPYWFCFGFRTHKHRPRHLSLSTVAYIVSMSRPPLRQEVSALGTASTVPALGSRMSSLPAPCSHTVCTLPAQRCRAMPAPSPVIFCLAPCHPPFRARLVAARLRASSWCLLHSTNVALPFRTRAHPSSSTPSA